MTTRLNEQDAKADQGVFARFVHWEAAGSVILLAAALVALVWANSPWADAYQHLLHLPISIAVAGAAFTLSLQHWVNDLLMATFFFLVGLEIKRELVAGQLSTLEKAALPVLAALGGLLAPAGLYALFNAGGPGASGWGVPMATDIAFALGLLALFGERVPVGLKVFLAALAIADDLGAVIVIAIFYTETIRVGALAVAAVGLVMLKVAADANVRRIEIYVLLSLFIWVAITASNLHPTVAGVLAAFAMPVRPDADSGEPAMGPMLEDYLHPAIAFVVMPLFALCNAGVTVRVETLHGIGRPVGLGIVVGLVLGKQLGIMAFSGLAVATGKAVLPEGCELGPDVRRGVSGRHRVHDVPVRERSGLCRGSARSGGQGCHSLRVAAGGRLGVVALRVALPREGRCDHRRARCRW